MSKIIRTLTFVVLGACAGGGGSDHIPPKSIHVGLPTPLTMVLRVWGAGFGKLSKRYTDIQCHYRIVGSDRYSAVPMTPIAESRDSLKVQCVIPALHAKPGDALEYYIDEKFDGVYNKRVEKPVPFE
jgi:hypothetical protein